MEAVVQYLFLYELYSKLYFGSKEYFQFSIFAGISKTSTTSSLNKENKTWKAGINSRNVKHIYIYIYLFIYLFDMSLNYKLSWILNKCLMLKSPFIERCWKVKRVGRFFVDNSLCSMNQFMWNAIVASVFNGARWLLLATLEYGHCLPTFQSAINQNIPCCFCTQFYVSGNVTIAECDPNGKFITLENTHRTKDENLGDHKLKRKLDKGREISYTIPPNTTLKAGRSMKRATHTQKTIQTGV
uniref:LTD domain-containing protein n=1 Tax=Heterorhabditis bacteriophora TaxID=37862 RepID=A0A1I7WBL1_HETBA